MFKTRFISMLVLLAAVATGAWAQEQSETIATTANIVEGTHFTISNHDCYVDEDGMNAESGITVTSKNGETITKVVISCTYGSDKVNDGNTSVSSGTKEITNDGGTITVTGVNASTFTFTCSDISPQFCPFVVYYTEAPAASTYDFEDGNMPAGWDASHANNKWYVATEDYYGYAPAYSGTYSLYVDGNGAYDSDYFISPALVFDGSAASLSFAYATPAWEGDHNDLSVCYGTSPNGPWNYTSFVWVNSSSWTTATVDLSSLNGTYYIAFESYDGYGYCTAIDNINITGAALAAPTTYTVTLKSDTDDATNWTITPAEATTTGVAAGTEVKATYGGTKKVKSVKAVKKAAAAAAKTLAEATLEDIGKIAGMDGIIYATKADAEAVATGNAVAMIAYVGTASDCTHGLAIALADESGTKDYGAAGTACSGKAPVTGGTWRLPSIKDWQYMFIGCGASGSYSDDPGSMSYSGLASKLTTAQGDALQAGDYWSSTETEPGDSAWRVYFEGSSAHFSDGWEDDGHLVRACLAF